MEIVLGIAILTGIGLLCALMLVIASKYMAVKTDSRVSDIRAMLPGANCGACGYTGCDGYAKALASGETTKTNLCIPGADAVAKNVSEYLGVKFEDVVEQVATIHCFGDCNKTSAKVEYQGISSCAAASMLHGGFGKCTYGCIGLGDCASVCPSGAICIENGIAHVNTRKCTGCGLCAKTCPHHLITLMADVSHVVVTCSNHDRGAVIKGNCSNGCIGCKKCERNCPSGAIKVENNLAVIDYSKCTNCGLCAKNCMSGCIMISDNRGIHRFYEPEEIKDQAEK